MRAIVDFIAAGGNRNPAAAAWSKTAPSLLAFGAGNNVALWFPEDSRRVSAAALLAAHEDVVNAVEIFELDKARFILSGAADRTVRVWAGTHYGGHLLFVEVFCLRGLGGPVTTITYFEAEGGFVVGTADGNVRLYQILDKFKPDLVQTIALNPRYIPLTTAFALLDGGGITLAVAGTSTAVQLYGRAVRDGQFELQATLTGHEGWIRGLSFADERRKQGQYGLLLATASQDKYIRLWRIQKAASTQSKCSNSEAGTTLDAGKMSLSKKTKFIGCNESRHSVTFEALLVGHEDWIYTVKWKPHDRCKDRPTLLSASADSSLAIWAADEASGVWVCKTRLGEISAQKGSTTATGSAGGYWLGLWSPDGQSVVALGRTGSWRRWKRHEVQDLWVQGVGISGHTREVQSLAWAQDGTHLLTVGSDQTTRLFAEWKRDGWVSWHEFSRPQIHGYDLNCIDTLTLNQFISGADEKLLRVFDKPRVIDKMLAKLSGSAPTAIGNLADAANIPVLGLSNKAVAAVDDGGDVANEIDRSADEVEALDLTSIVHRSILDLVQPPPEDLLSKHTLWPEHEKLYGHGYEISTVAASPDNLLVATACKASSIDHAVIRLYETQGWRQVKPPLSAHSLTVTSLAFSPDGRYLLSVGRDRQWTVFVRENDVSSHGYRLLTKNATLHTRMILDCSWAPIEFGHLFATAGRDKMVKIWRLLDNNDNANVGCLVTIAKPAAVTAVAFSLTVVAGTCRLAIGMEDGSVAISVLDATIPEVEIKSSNIEKTLTPSKAVNTLRWRPYSAEFSQLAIASDDGSVRILRIDE